MDLSIKCEWFRDWFRGGFVWFRGVSCIFLEMDHSTQNSVLFSGILCLFHEAREVSKLSQMEEQCMTARQYIGRLNAHGLNAGVIPFVYTCTYCVFVYMYVRLRM